MQLNAVELHYNVHIYCIDTSIERNPALQFQTFAKLRRSTKQVESAKIHQHASQSTVENLGLASTCRSFCFRNWGKRRAKSSKRRSALENVTRFYSHATCSKHVNLSVLPLGLGQEFCKGDQQERATSSRTTRSVSFVHHMNHIRMRERPTRLLDWKGISSGSEEPDPKESSS